MKNFPRLLLFILMILVVSTYLVACQAATPTPFGGAPTPGISVSITGNICPSLTVTAGDQITWTNQDQRVHLIHIESSDGNLVFDSGELQPGDATSFTFPQTGLFYYVCSSDRGSSGTITFQP